MLFPRRSFGVRFTVGKSEVLDMAGRAGLGSAGGHSLIVKEPAAQFDFGFGHGIVEGDAGFGESGGEIPFIGGLGQGWGAEQEDSG
jgi:hypothetical protein